MLKRLLHYVPSLSFDYHQRYTFKGNVLSDEDNLQSRLFPCAVSDSPIVTNASKL